MKFKIGEKVSVNIMLDTHTVEIIDFNFGGSKAKLKFPHGGTFWEDVSKISKLDKKL